MYYDCNKVAWNFVTWKGLTDVHRFFHLLGASLSCHHGSSPVLLNLYSETYVDVLLILNFRPNLHTSVFNADYCIEPHNDVADSQVTWSISPISSLQLVCMGCAFGAGNRYLQVATYHPPNASSAARSNDLNMGALNGCISRTLVEYGGQQVCA
jgi:hypothetical protein